MRHYLSRAAFALIVFGLAMGYNVYRQSEDGTLVGVRKGVYMAIAVISLAAGVAGMKERHRTPDDL